MTDRELDIEVAVKVLCFRDDVDVKGYHVLTNGSATYYTNMLAQCGSFAMQYDPPLELPHYSTDISAAWRVVDALETETKP